MRVERLQQAFDLEIVYRAFPLHPDTPEEGLTLEELFAGRGIDIPAAKQRMSQLMMAEGLPYGERTMTYNSRLAQELGRWADSTGNGSAMHLALFQAYFVDNTNLAKTENLIEIVQRLGLSTDEAQRVVDERLFREEVDGDWSRARQLGITGVPTFVLGNRGLVGAQAYEQLESFALSSGVSRRQA